MFLRMIFSPREAGFGVSVFKEKHLFIYSNGKDEKFKQESLYGIQVTLLNWCFGLGLKFSKDIELP